MNIAIVGATGNVGRKILEVLEKKGLSIEISFLCITSIIFLPTFPVAPTIAIFMMINLY